MNTVHTFSPHLKALLEVGAKLRGEGYKFITPTPETHRRVLGRDPHRLAQNSVDIFGWNRRFRNDLLDAGLFGVLHAVGHLEAAGDLWRSRIRFSSLGEQLFVHSGYPTEAADSVFFGPDTYRYVRFLKQVGVRGGRAVDIGAGAGPGGLSVAAQVESVVLTDINPRALEYGRLNSQLNEIPLANIDFILGEGPHAISGEADWILANPPFLADPKKRAYRDGGGDLGAALSIEWTRQAYDRLRPGGRFVLYTGSAIRNGHDQLKQTLHAFAQTKNAKLEYAEIDVDIFGEELETPAYSEIDRIAAVGTVLLRR